MSQLLKLKPELFNPNLEMTAKLELNTLLLKLCETGHFAKSVTPVLIQSGNRKSLDLL